MGRGRRTPRRCVSIAAKAAPTTQDVIRPDQKASRGPAFKTGRRPPPAAPALPEHHRALPRQQHPVLAVPLHGARQHLAFGVAADGGQVFHRLAVVHAGHVLLDDRAFVQVGRHVVRGGADQLDAALVRLPVGLGALEAGQETVVDVDGTPGEVAAQLVRQDLHVARQHHQLGAFALDDLQLPCLGLRLVGLGHREAEDCGALLLIDEVDSFLQDRQGAQRSWDVSQVNEMLTQMESFAGVFIASTNLIDGLDPAALRRFDLKVKLDFLRADQAWALLQRHCAQLVLPAPGAAEQASLARLKRLTPGDFAAVLRQSRFVPVTSAAALVAGLEGECGLKRDGRAAIGFV